MKNYRHRFDSDLSFQQRNANLRIFHENLILSVTDRTQSYVPEQESISRVVVHIMIDGILADFDTESRATCEQFSWEDIQSIDLRQGSFVLQLFGQGRATLLPLISSDDCAALDQVWRRQWQSGFEPGSSKPALMRRSRSSNQKRSYAIGLVIALIMIAPIAIGSQLVSNGGLSSTCRVVSMKIDPDLFWLNGKSDAGFTIRGTLSNKGKERLFKVAAQIDTTEGRFVGEQDYLVSEDSSLEVKVGFPEPTDFARVKHGVITCS